ncbi:lanthionine synthetase C family protein [Aquimarina pacifica]|uniref:lanthionine synthetase C family protein n=1 Tax=Aquimarina pacifica TaxID=1296415 RepID=UPI000472AF59|nr:lanthionine synthetase C family protein [Aquimarina pacifica]
MEIENLFKNKLKEIGEILNAKSEEISDVGVLSGISGVALFQFYYSKFLEDDSFADQGAENLMRMVELINTGNVLPTFCTGVAGACWVLEILKEEELVALDDDFLSSDLDSFLLEVMRKDIKKENFDFLHGAIGYGYYFLKRYKNSSSQKLKNKYKKYLDELVISLKTLAKQNDEEIWWESPLQIGGKDKGCNLSLSHGVASIINFLARLGELTVFYKDVHELLIKASGYILAHQNNDKTLSATFPNWVVEGEVNEGYSRLSWCYGDLGIGISLLRVGEVLENRHIYDEALRILKKSTRRRDPKEAGIHDAGLCHGTFGILHIYNYLYKKTKDEDFRKAMIFWAEQSLQIDIHKNGYAGYMVWNVNDEEQWKPDTSLLEGIAGIGLSILSYLSPFDSKWDESIMIG